MNNYDYGIYLSCSCFLIMSIFIEMKWYVFLIFILCYMVWCFLIDIIKENDKVCDKK